jgi:hypothetical protein
MDEREEQDIEQDFPEAGIFFGVLIIMGTCAVLIGLVLLCKFFGLF